MDQARTLKVDRQEELASYKSEARWRVFWRRLRRSKGALPMGTRLDPQRLDFASSMWTPLLPSTICVTRRLPASEHSM